MNTFEQLLHRKIVARVYHIELFLPKNLVHSLSGIVGANPNFKSFMLDGQIKVYNPITYLTTKKEYYTHEQPRTL